MPSRVQLSRHKGWKMPENTVSVARPTVWGNPYSVERYGLDLCLEMFAETARGGWNPSIIPDSVPSDDHSLYDAHTAWLERLRKVFGRGNPSEIIRYELRGKNLACWCPLRDSYGRQVRCHADLLLEIANE